MTPQEEIDATVCELATLLGWTRVYAVEVDPRSINWRNKHGQVVSANWMSNPGQAMQLLLDHTTGYYETMEGTNSHCIVISSPLYFGTGPQFESTVVYLKDHTFKKSRALAYAIMVAAVKSLKTQQHRP